MTRLYPQALGSVLVAYYDTHGVRWGYSDSRPPHGRHKIMVRPNVTDEVFCKVESEDLYII